MTQRAITDFMSTLDEQRDAIQDQAYVQLSNAAAAVHAAAPAGLPPREELPFPPIDIFNIRPEEACDPAYASALLKFLSRSYEEKEGDDGDGYHPVHSFTVMAGAFAIKIDLGYREGWEDEDGEGLPGCYYAYPQWGREGAPCNSYMYWMQINVPTDTPNVAHTFMCELYNLIKQLQERGLCPRCMHLNAPGKEACFECLLTPSTALRCAIDGCDKLVCLHWRVGDKLACSHACAEKLKQAPRKRRRADDGAASAD